MKIALCKSHFAGPVSGADETLVAYAIWLDQAGYSVKVVLLHPHAKNDQYYKRLSKAGIEVSCILEGSFTYTIIAGSTGTLLQRLFLSLSGSARASTDAQGLANSDELGFAYLLQRMSRLFCRQRTGYVARFHARHRGSTHDSRRA